MSGVELGGAGSGHDGDVDVGAGDVGCVSETVRDMIVRAKEWRV